MVCRARDELEEERMARIDAEDIVSKLQEQLAEVQHEEMSARQAAETRLASLSQEYESLKDKVSHSLSCYFHQALACKQLLVSCSCVKTRVVCKNEKK